MTISYAMVGMGLIILSWVVQIIFTLKGKKAVRPCFAGMQFLGIALLVVDTFTNLGQMTTLAWMNVASALLALVMMILAFRK